MKKKKKPYRLFTLGSLAATPRVLESVPGAELTTALMRHLRGDWGDVSDEDRAANDRAVKGGDRIVSSYHSTDGVKFCIITEWDRSATTILLSGEY